MEVPFFLVAAIGAFRVSACMCTMMTGIDTYGKSVAISDALFLWVFVSKTLRGI